MWEIRQRNQRDHFVNPLSAQVRFRVLGYSIFIDNYKEIIRLKFVLKGKQGISFKRFCCSIDYINTQLIPHYEVL